MLSRVDALHRADVALSHAIKQTNFNVAASWDELEAKAKVADKLTLESILYKKSEELLHGTMDFLEKQGASVSIIHVKPKDSSAKSHDLLLVNSDPAAIANDPSTWGKNAVIINPLVTAKALKQGFGFDYPAQVLSKNPLYGQVFLAEELAHQLIIHTTTKPFSYTWKRYSEAFEFQAETTKQVSSPKEKVQSKQENASDYSLRFDFSVVPVPLPKPEVPEAPVLRAKL